tara:strand:- start:5 stop:268 length:264 start_codon:yes stop_codon:yes gene_type:complete
MVFRLNYPRLLVAFRRCFLVSLLLGAFVVLTLAALSPNLDLMTVLSLLLTKVLAALGLAALAVLAVLAWDLVASAMVGLRRAYSAGP